jgi:small subunit ribosomal protein S3
MSVVKRIIRDNIERMKVDELLADEFEQAGYGGITLTKTPLGAQINLFTMRPGRVIGKRGRSIKAASERLEVELGLENPQITVVEVEVPELNPRIMASRIANALERGVHYRRAIFWSLNRIMESGAIGCEVLLKGPLRSSRSRFEKVVEGYVPKSGDPALKYVKTHTIHVKMKRGTLGVNVSIVPPDAKFPDKVSLDELPDIEYPEPEAPAPTEEAVPEASEAEISAPEAQETVEPPAEAASEAVPEPVPEPVEQETPAVEPIEEASEPEITEPVDEPKAPETDVEPGEEKAPEIEAEPVEEKGEVSDEAAVSVEEEASEAPEEKEK